MPKKFSLVAFDFGARLEKGELPTRLLVCPWGETATRKGKILVNETTVAQLNENQALNKYDRVALDFGHNTVPGAPGPEPRKVAGYGTPEVVEGEGIYLSAIEYTADGLALLPAGHYPDISPAVMRNEMGEVVFLHSVGAVRQGEIDGLTLFSASDDLDLASFEAGEEEDPDASDATEPSDLRGILVSLLNALSPDSQLAAEASDGDIAAAARAAAERMTALSSAPSAEEVTALAARLDKFEADFAASTRRQILDRAAREGKVVPLGAAELERLDLTVLESMVEKLPATVPMESRLHGATDNFAATPGNAAITPELREVARQMGLKPEELL
jgi:phage I-like protein